MFYLGPEAGEMVATATITIVYEKIILQLPR